MSKGRLCAAMWFGRQLLFLSSLFLSPSFTDFALFSVSSVSRSISKVHPTPRAHLIAPEGRLRLRGLDNPVTGSKDKLHAAQIRIAAQKDPPPGGLVVIAVEGEHKARDPF